MDKNCESLRLTCHCAWAPATYGHSDLRNSDSQRCVLNNFQRFVAGRVDNKPLSFYRCLSRAVDGRIIFGSAAGPCFEAERMFLVKATARIIETQSGEF